MAPGRHNLEVPGSIPGSPGSLFGHFLVMSGVTFYDLWDVLGWVWDGFNVFGVGVRERSDKVENLNFRKCQGMLFQGWDTQE